MKRAIMMMLVMGLLGLTGCQSSDTQSEENTDNQVVESTEEASSSKEEDSTAIASNNFGSKDSIDDSKRSEMTQDFGGGKEGGIRPDMDFTGEIVIPDGIGDDLREQIEALPEMIQMRLIMELPDEITEETEAAIAEMIEAYENMDFDALGHGGQGTDGMAFPEGMEPPEGMDFPEGMDAPQGGQGHHHQGLSDEAYTSTERISLDGSVDYKDGTFVGTADGFSNDLTVSVTIEDNTIVEIAIISHNETPGFYEQAFELIPEYIMNSQSTEVDTVSGATYSSQGIILAVEAALSAAQE